MNRRRGDVSYEDHQRPSVDSCHEVSVSVDEMTSLVDVPQQL